MPKPVNADRLAAVGASAGIRHGFFTRHGGVSRGGYASLNCGLGSRDDPDAVAENRTRVSRFLDAHSLLTAHQVHSPTAVVVDRPWSREERPRADAIVTGTPGIALGVLTADCAPVLLADPQARVVAAAHAGWRGAIGGVLEATLAAMEGLGARRDRIEAAVGPCIMQPNYEVGPEFEHEFLTRDPSSAPFFSRPQDDPQGRPHFDLPGYVLQRLKRAGLAPVDAASCTYAGAEDFFSYRRSRADRGENDYGRQISAIALT
jgi:YfiH family protein